MRVVIPVRETLGDQRVVTGDDVVFTIGQAVDLGEGFEGLRQVIEDRERTCLLYTSPSPRDRQKSRMPSSA